MSQILSLRIPEEMVDRLDRFARRLGNGTTRARASVLLLEEALREAEFAGIEFRDSAVGRQAYMKGSGLAIWEVILVARHYGMDPHQIARDYPYPVENLTAAVTYYDAYRSEIDQAIADNQIGADAMKRRLPTLQVFDAAPGVDGTRHARTTAGRKSLAGRRAGIEPEAPRDSRNQHS